MNGPLLYFSMSMAALLVLAVLAYVTVRSGRPTRLTPFTALAFAFVLAGILIGEGGLVAYGLVGIGLVMALVDIIMKSRGPVG